VVSSLWYASLKTNRSLFPSDIVSIITRALSFEEGISKRDPSSHKRGLERSQAKQEGAVMVGDSLE
jgi:hypothetical protein